MGSGGDNFYFHHYDFNEMLCNEKIVVRSRGCIFFWQGRNAHRSLVFIPQRRRRDFGYDSAGDLRRVYLARPGEVPVLA